MPSVGCQDAECQVSVRRVLTCCPVSERAEQRSSALLPTWATTIGSLTVMEMVGCGDGPPPVPHRRHRSEVRGQR